MKTTYACWCLVALAALLPVAAAAQPADNGDAPIDGPPAPTPPAVVSRDAQGRVTVRAVRIDRPIQIDGRLDDEAYARIPSISDFIQQEPDEGAQATEQTEVWVLFDDRMLYIAARCWDSQPLRMVANEMRRDNQNIFQNENFAVALDTFYDRRNAFYFHTNPLGGLFDGYVTDERETNRDWNTVWDLKTQRFDQGWTVEMEIPFKSLRYNGAGPQIWGINFRRVVRWKNEFSYLTRIPAAYGMRGLTKISSAATLVGLETPTGSKNLEIKPYAVSGLATNLTAETPVVNDLTGNVGVDVKYGLTRGLTADFTYNTDFAQVEDDEQQVNLTRFSLFFPEKRDFFLEGQGIFSFGGGQNNPRGGGGGGGGPDNTPILFFSRRIGLNDEDEVVPIEGGGRLTGRVGKYSVGFLNIQTESDREGAPAGTNFTVVRVKRDILRRSSIGMIATRRAPSVAADRDNLAVGVDATLSFYENLSIDGHYARTRTPGLSEREESYRGAFNYNGDRYGLQVEHLLVGENFNPEVGFLRREDFRRTFVEARFSPRPRAPSSIRKYTYQGSLDYFTDPRGRLETREVQLRFGTEFQSGDQFNVNYQRSFEFLPEPFEITDEVSIPSGAYHFQELRASYRLGPQHRVSGWINASHGTFYDGTRTEAQYRGRAEISSKLSMEPGLSINWVDLPQGKFTTTLIRTRTTFTLTPRMFVGALIQYNSGPKLMTTNVRFRWEYIPGSEFFLVYSDGRDTLGSGFPRLEDRSLVAKVTRLVRF